LRSDLTRFKRISLENKQLIQKINQINRTKGYIDSFPNKKQAISSTVSRTIRQNKTIEEENQRLYYRILTAVRIITNKRIWG
jgi:FAD synthase